MSRQLKQGVRGTEALLTLTRMGLLPLRSEASDLWWLGPLSPLPEAAKRKPGRDPEEEEAKPAEGDDEEDDDEDEEVDDDIEEEEL